jgi:hypothetical protein
MAKVRHEWLGVQDFSVLNQAVAGLRSQLETSDPTSSSFTKVCRQALKEHADRQLSKPAYEYFVGLVNRLLQARSMGQVNFVFQTTIPPQLSV